MYNNSVIHYKMIFQLPFFDLLGLHTRIPKNQKQLLHPAGERGSPWICSQRDRVRVKCLND